MGNIMGSGFKKGKAIDMGNYVAKPIEQDAYVWCIHNNILIAPKAKSNTEWYITISINGKVNTSPIAYEKVEIWKELYKFYLYYYEKYSGVKFIENKTDKIQKFTKNKTDKPKLKQIINEQLF
jgi:hypothetical protein